MAFGSKMNKVLSCYTNVYKTVCVMMMMSDEQ